MLSACAGREQAGKLVLRLGGCPFEVEDQEVLQDFFVAEVVGPGVGVEDGVVGWAVDVVEMGLGNGRFEKYDSIRS